MKPLMNTRLLNFFLSVSQELIPFYVAEYYIVWIHVIIYQMICWGTFELFPVFGITDKGALNMQAQVLYGHMPSVLLGIYLGLELLGHRKVYF